MSVLRERRDDLSWHGKGRLTETELVDRAPLPPERVYRPEDDAALQTGTPTEAGAPGESDEADKAGASKETKESGDADDSDG